MPASCTVCLYCKSFKYRRCASAGIRRTAVFVESGCKGTHFFPNTQTFRGFFFVKKGISGLSLTWVKGMGKAYILYIYAHGRDGQAPQPSCGEQDGRRWTGGAGGKAGTGGRRNPAAKLRGTVAIMEGERGDGRAPQPSCGEQDGRQGDGTGNWNGT